MQTISRKLKAELKLGAEREYRIAQRAGVNPSTLSKLLNGIVAIKSDDERIVAVGRVLGLRPDECFERLSDG